MWCNRSANSRAVIKCSPVVRENSSRTLRKSSIAARNLGHSLFFSEGKIERYREGCLLPGYGSMIPQFWEMHCEFRR
jgi:hypothetical protein